MQILLYNIIVNAYLLGIRLAAHFHQKARLWVEGRRGIFDKIEGDFAQRAGMEGPVVWFHCASLGEFEQGRTVVEALRREAPKAKILLTFFSPSGYALRKNYPSADWVHYLPPDSEANARRFVGAVRPDLVFFVKYEFWFHYLNTLKKQGIPTLLIAAAFRPQQPFFAWYGGLHRDMLDCFVEIFTQDKTSIELLQAQGRTNATLAGDPRTDRVLEIAAQERHFPEITAFCGGQNVLVAGSTWPRDETLLHALLYSPVFSGWKMILAPHDVSDKRLGEIMALFGKRAVRHRDLTDAQGADVLVVDSIGKLAWLYQYGRLAYIGGGFGQGIHNLLEPMAFGLPVVFGPRFEKFTEAKSMLEKGGGFVVENEKELVACFEKLSGENEYGLASATVRAYIQQNQGATEKVMFFLRNHLSSR